MQGTKVQAIFDVLDQGDPKTALKTFNKEIEKNGKKIMKDPLAKAHTQMMKAAISAASGRPQETDQEVDEALGEILKASETPGQVRGKDLVELFKQIENMMISIGIS